MLPVIVVRMAIELVFVELLLDVLLFLVLVSALSPIAPLIRPNRPWTVFVMLGFVNMTIRLTIVTTRMHLTTDRFWRPVVS